MGRYTFPKPLAPLREYLRGQGVDVRNLASARQAAFLAQQQIGTRSKFPPQGEDMGSTLHLIQAELETGRAAGVIAPQLPVKRGRKAGRLSNGKGNRELPYSKKASHLSSFGPEVFSAGIHIFCDGSAAPNPGAGGWGVVVYRDGVEVENQFGGDPCTTNNAMELTAMLKAIELATQLLGNPEALEGHPGENGGVTIWSDSDYVVTGIADWMPMWKARGWNRRKANSPKREEGEIKNLELWQAIDEALTSVDPASVAIRWVKGHIGVAGNERADELAEQGSEAFSATTPQSTICDDLDERYRQLMSQD